MSVTVWAKSLAGQWQRIGTDRALGVWPEGLRATANDWGSNTCSFLLRRDPYAEFPDLLPFTPVDVDVAGQRVWSGFVWESPQQADERAVAVECRGWQYHLDDDLVDRLYVHSRLDAWQDARQSLATALTVWQPSGFVEASGGALVFGWEQDAQANAGQHVGVTLDLGRTEAKRVVLDLETIGGNAAFTFVIRGHDSGDPNPSAGDFTAGLAQDSATAMESLGTGFKSFTFTNPHRYVTLFLYRDDGVSALTAANHLVRVKQAMVFRSTVYESGNASVLKASQVATDLLPFCLLLDQRTHLIQDSPVSLPDFSLEDNTPRQGMEQANAVEGRQLRVTPERLLEYRPRPVVPLVVVGQAGLVGAARGSGESIHNRVVVKGNDSSGGRVVVDLGVSGDPTLADRRAFVRARGIRVSRAISTGTATDIADAALAEAMRTPFKGDLVARHGDVRLYRGGGPVHPAGVLRHAGELVHLPALVDPDNGNLGRDARMVAVTYDDDAGLAQVTLDNTRTDFETQLAKYEATGRR